MELQIRELPVRSSNPSIPMVGVIIAMVLGASRCATMPHPAPPGIALPGEAIHARPARIEHCRNSLGFILLSQDVRILRIERGCD